MYLVKLIEGHEGIRMRESVALQEHYICEMLQCGVWLNEEWHQIGKIRVYVFSVTGHLVLIQIVLRR